MFYISFTDLNNKYKRHNNPIHKRFKTCKIKYLISIGL